MKNKTLWRRVAAVALAAVLAVPTAMMPAKTADAKTIRKAILEEDFSAADYDASITAWGAAKLSVTDGTLKVTGSGTHGARWILPVEENTTYRISYRVKVEMLNEQTSTFAFRQSWTMNDDGTDVEGSYGDAEYANASEENVWPAAGWKQVETTYTVPEGKNHTQFVVYNNDDVDFEFYLDDIKVEKDVEVADVIANGTFGTDAANTVGWDLKESTVSPKIETVYAANENFDNGTSGITIAPFGAGVCELVDGAVKITGKGGARFDAIPVKGGQTYTISYRHKLCTEGLQTNGYVETYNSGSNRGEDYLQGALAYTSPLNEWFDASTTYTVPEGQNQLCLTVYNNNSAENAEFWVDDLKIYAETAATETTYETVYDSEGFDNANTAYGVNWAGTNVVVGEGVNGTSAQKMERPVGATGNATLYFTSDTAFFETGVTYLVKFKARSTESATWRCYYDGMGTPNWVALGDYSGTTEWAEYSYTFTATDSLVWPQAGFQIVGGAGCLYIDDFVIQKVTTTQLYNTSDGVGNFGKDGNGAQITDKTATATVSAAAGRYDYSVDVKGAEGTSVKVYVNDTVCGEATGNGKWQTVTGTFDVKDEIKTFAIESKGTVVFDNVEVHAHQHTSSLVAEVAASCTKEGVAAHYECKGCGEKFLDRACTKEATDDALVLTKTAHKYVVTKTKATTKADAKEISKCACGAKTERVIAYRIKSVTVSNKTYNGKNQTVSVVVKDSKNKTISSANYTLDRTKVKDVGSYKIKVTFKGNYSGTSYVTLKVLPKATSLSSVKAGKKSATVKWAKQASGTTGYKIQVSTDKNFKKSVKTYTVKKNKTTSYTVKSLKAKKTYYVRVCTYKGSLQSSWSKTKSVKIKK